MTDEFPHIDLEKISVDCYNASVNVTDRIKTFKDACYATDTVFPGYPKETPKQVLAFAKLAIIVEALNEGWEPDWNNGRECKYYPWFDMQSGFSLIRVFSSDAYSAAPGRLFFKTKAVAKYAATQFLGLYKQLYT